MPRLLPKNRLACLLLTALVVAGCPAEPPNDPPNEPEALVAVALPSGSALPLAVVGSAWSFAFEAKGGTKPYSWSVAAGELPPGLTLASDTGLLAGVPSSAGAFDFEVTVHDAGSPEQSATIPASVTVVAPLDTADAAHVVGAGTTFALPLSISGGVPPYVVEATTELPGDVELVADEEQWVLAGRVNPDELEPAPSSSTFAVALTVTDSAASPHSAEVAVSLEVRSLGFVLDGAPNGPESLADAVESGEYDVQLATGSGIGAVTFATTPADLPPGLTLSADGRLQGSVEDGAAGEGVTVYDFTVTATDTGEFGQTISHPFRVEVVRPLSFAGASFVGDAVRGMAFAMVGAPLLERLGGGRGATFIAEVEGESVAAGDFPVALGSSGLLLSADGTLSGNVNASLSSPFVFTVTFADELRPTAQTVTRTFSLEAHDPLTVTTTSAELKTATVGVAYADTVAFTGGKPGTQTFVAAELGNGLSLDAAGNITGTPTSAAPVVFSPVLMDGANLAQTAPAVELTISVREALTIAEVAPLDLVVGDAGFSHTFTATGGLAPLTWTLTGTLPDGLSWDAGSATLSGTPSAAGSATLTVAVSDAGSPQASDEYVFTLNAYAPLVITTTDAELKTATMDLAYADTVAFTGGKPGTQAFVAAELGNGLSLDADGNITGTPTSTAPVVFSPVLTDGASPAQTAPAVELTIQVREALTIAEVAPVDLVVGKPGFSHTFTAVGGRAPLTWTLTGTLPDGLSWDADTATVSGTPSAAGSATLTVAVSDAGSPQASDEYVFTLNVYDPLAIDGAGIVLGDAVPGKDFNMVPGAVVSAVTGGRGAYSFTAGPLVDATHGATGLSSDAAGVLSGTLNAGYPGNSITFDVEVSDELSPVAQTASSAFIIEVHPELLLTGGTAVGDGVRSQPFTMTGLPLLSRLSGGRGNVAIVEVNGALVEATDFPVDLSGSGLFLDWDGTVSGTIDPDLADDGLSFTVRFADSLRPEAQEVEESFTLEVTDPAPATPENFAASTGDEDHVLLTWAPSRYATSYAIYRKEAGAPGEATLLVYLDASDAFHEDATAASNTPAVPALTVTNGPDRVELSWTEPDAGTAPTYVYAIVAWNDAGLSPLSAPVEGRRAVKAIAGYEVAVDGAPVGGIVASTGWLHTSAAAGSIDTSGATLTASQGSSTEFVTLSVSGISSHDGTTYGYAVRATTGEVEGAWSTEASGHRTASLTGYQWQRSAGDTDGDYADIAGATTANWVDTTAPADGEHRFYRVVISAVGASDVTVGPAAGWRAGPDCTDGMCLIPAGPFWRGCIAGPEEWMCEDNEKPGGEISLSAFEMDQTEVTQSAYKVCVDAGQCNSPSLHWDPVNKGDRPVVYVTWQEASDYCAWAGKRLPTEAEWEKAARGTGGRVYPWGSNIPNCDFNNYSGCGGTSKPVGSSPAGDSPYGLKDMAGNVWEWVADWYDAAYYAESPYENPQGPETGSSRVVHGGSFYDGSGSVRASRRLGAAPDSRQDRYGFRCARSVLP